MAAPDGSYQLVIPIGDSPLAYGGMAVSAFDPVSDLTLSSAVVDLRGINPYTPVKGSAFLGLAPTQTQAIPTLLRSFVHGGHRTVDNFVLRKPPISINRNSFQPAARNGFNINHLECANFNRVQ